MSTFPAQTLPTPPVLTAEGDLKEQRLRLKEAQWWALWPGEAGYGTPLHEYLGFTESEWRDFAISARRVR